MRTPRHVLVIEDNPDGRSALCAFLGLLGHRVDAAVDGEEGLAKGLADRPEVAVIDIGLPCLDGFRVAQRLRAALGPGILLVAHTGYGQPEDQRRGREAGFDAYLVKPADPADLAAWVARGPAHT
jgi:CheY-like chemotaxis protein